MAVTRQRQRQRRGTKRRSAAAAAASSLTLLSTCVVGPALISHPHADRPTQTSSMHIIQHAGPLPCVSAFTGGGRTSTRSSTRITCNPLYAPASLLSEQEHMHVRGINNNCPKRAPVHASVLDTATALPSSSSSSFAALHHTSTRTLTSLSSTSTSTGMEKDGTAANAATEQGGGRGDSNNGVKSKSQGGGSNKKPKRKRRPAPNKRIGLKWVVESVEKCLIEEKGYKSGHGDESDGSDNTDATTVTSDWDERDVRLVDALWKLCWANTPREVSQAGNIIESLDLAKNASVAVQERVIKATAVAGLLQQSCTLLEKMLGGDLPSIPSVVAYTALLNGLRQSGRIGQMEKVLVKLGHAYRSCADSGDDIGLDIIALNTYLAAICDAADASYESSRPRRRRPASMQRKRWPSDAKSFNDHLSDAVDLLEPGVAREKLFATTAPDLQSYNTILSCASRVKARSAVERVLRLMERSGTKGDIYTYNARIRLSSLTPDKNSDVDNNEAIQLIDEVLANSSLQPDMYTIDLALVPLVRAGRKEEILQLINDCEGFVGSSTRRRYLSALSSFLTTLVKADEVEFARNLFDSFVLPLIPDDPPNPAESMPQIDSGPVPIGKIKTAQSRRLQTFTIHFNTLIEGYRRSASALGDNQIHEERLVNGQAYLMLSEDDDPRRCADNLFDFMISRGICPDGYTVTSMIGLQETASGVTQLWKRATEEFQIKMTPIIFHSLMTAYGKIGDPSSACWTFDRMLATQGQRITRKSWNVFLGSLSNGSRGEDPVALDIFASNAAVGIRDVVESSFEVVEAADAKETRTTVMTTIDGIDCAQAALAVLKEMQSERHTPRPDSQSYCLVASTMSHGEPCPEDAIELFRNALSSDIPADGRFINACIRCFGNEVDKAILTWKNEMRGAVVSHENRKRPASSAFSKKRKKNLAAAYHGLLHVCGKAERPDVALRLVYAMNKEEVEPSETSYNSYLKGKEERKDGKAVIRMMANQYESLLQVECLKYDTRDKRRESEQRIRIIF